MQENEHRLEFPIQNVKPALDEIADPHNEVPVTIESQLPEAVALPEPPARPRRVKKIRANFYVSAADPFP